MNTQARKAALESQLSEVIGEPVEITIRGKLDFTFSTFKPLEDFAERLVAFFGARMTITDEAHDEECGSFVYMRANA